MTDKTDLAAQAALAALPVILGKAQAIKSCDDERISQCVELAIAVGENFADAMTAKTSTRKKSKRSNRKKR